MWSSWAATPGFCIAALCYLPPATPRCAIPCALYVRGDTDTLSIASVIV